MATRVKISPETLVWAAERGGYTTDILLDVFPKALDWIKEESTPTVKQLENFAKKVHIPFGFLFLKQPPKEEIPITFYRSNGQIFESPPLIIRDLVNSVKTKQEWLTDYLRDNNFEELEFIGKLSNFKNIKISKAADLIRKYLDANIDWYKETNNSQVFRYWIDKFEKNRIFVISTGYVGHNKRSVDVNICKGFTLIDNMCPFIYINTNNRGGGKIFTLIHELVHIFIGNSMGLSYEPIHPSSEPLEKFCDNVASELLVPQILFNDFWKNTKGDNVAKFTKLAGIFHVSKLVIAKKALDSNFIEIADFWSFYNYYTNIPFKQVGGGDYWNSKPYEVSRKFFNYVDVALNQNSILPSEAYKLTNMKGKTYDNFKLKS
jgi:Zn-dependent peptidase ImmA (M78 family)